MVWSSSLYEEAIPFLFVTPVESPIRLSVSCCWTLGHFPFFIVCGHMLTKHAVPDFTGAASTLDTGASLELHLGEKHILGAG